jgi:hypothetical protein
MNAPNELKHQHLIDPADDEQGGTPPCISPM